MNTNVPTTSAVIDLIMPDGSQFSFAKQLNGTWIYTTIPALLGAVMVAVQGSIDLHWKDGTTFRFVPSNFQVGSVLTSISDPNGNTTTIFHASSNPERILQITDPVGRSLVFTYESHGYISSITDPLGRTVGYGYSTHEISGAHVLTQVVYPDGTSSTFVYDSVEIGSVGALPLASSVLTRIIDARGVDVAVNTYDSNGRVVEQLRPNGSRLHFDYTLSNPLVPLSPVLETKVTDAREQPTIYRFSPQGFLLNVTDPLGQTKTFERNGNNQVQAMRGNGVCDVCGDPGAGDVSFTYDGNGNLLTQTDALGKTTTLAYKTVTDPELGFPRFTRLDSITDPLGGVTGFTYDSHGNLTARADANGHTTHLSYNTRGLPTDITDPLGNHTTPTYDGLGNVTTITDPLGQATSIRYDAVSRPIEVIDALGRRSSTTYDTLDRVLTRTNTQNGVTQFSYDPVGNLVSLIDPLGRTTSFTYDSMNQLVTRTTPLGKTDSRSYDPNGNLEAFIDRRGQGSSFGYDPLNRLVTEGYSGGVKVSLSYDAHSRVARVDDSEAGAFTFAYNDVGRTLSATSPFGTVQYDYDSLGQVLSRQVVGQTAVDYDYDPVGNLLAASTPLATVNFAYDARDQLLNMTRSNGVSSSYTHDPLGRVLSLMHAKGTIVLNSQTYTYDAVGNRTSYVTNIAQSLITQPVSNAYDNSNRLLTSGPKTFTYDDNGNLASEGGPEGTITYIWDGRNRLRSLALPNGQTLSFLYDFAGNIIQQQVSGGGPTTSQEFVLDRLTNIAYQKNSDGSQFSVLTGRTIDSHLAVIGSAGQVDFGLSDTINSTVATVNQNGQAGGQFFYEPFGQTTSGSAYPFQFTGRVPVTGSLYYYRARFYSSTLGRFISEDPIGFAGGTNFYAYVRNRPTLFVDSRGLDQSGVEVNISDSTAIDAKYYPNKDSPGQYFVVCPSAERLESQITIAEEDLVKLQGERLLLSALGFVLPLAEKKYGEALLNGIAGVTGLPSEPQDIGRNFLFDKWEKSEQTNIARLHRQLFAARHGCLCGQNGSYPEIGPLLEEAQ